MSWSRVDNQVNSNAATAIERYSASALERETVGYFLALHDIVGSDKHTTARTRTSRFKTTSPICIKKSVKNYITLR